MSASTRFGNERGGGRRRRSSAFTLVELLVVIAIIVLLLGLAAAMGPAILNRGAEQVTTSRLQNLQTIYETYMSVTDQTNEDGRVFSDLDAFLTAADDLEGLVAPLRALGSGLKSTELYVPKFDTDLNQWDFKFISQKTVLDGWENPIFFKAGDGMTGRNEKVTQADHEYFFDPIGELNEFVSDKARFAKIPDVGHAYFASPGPNGMWGRVQVRPLPPDTWEPEDDTPPWVPQDSSIVKDPQFQERYAPSGNTWRIEPLDGPSSEDPVDQPRERDNIYSYEVGE